MSHNTDVTIHVKYADKDDAKKMGAWFNAESRSWFIPQGEKHKNYDYLISKYNQPIKKGKKIYLNVPFDDAIDNTDTVSCDMHKLLPFSSDPSASMTAAPSCLTPLTMIL
jgi:hypothetical protein